MKILLIYFSGTGNTKRISDLYKTAFEYRGAEVDSLELPLTTPLPDIDGYDLIGLGYPIHGFNAPKLLLTLCKQLPKRNKKTDGYKKAFIFKTSGEPVRMSDVSSLKMRKILKRRGYAVNNEYQYVMPYNIIFRHTDSQVYKMWTVAQKLVPADVDEILQGGARLPKKIFMGGFLAWILRCEHWGAHIIGKTYKAKKDCVKCGKCVKLCPMGNIRTNKKGKIKFGGKCIICMRCVQSCPKAAINMGLLNGWKVNGAYSFTEPDEPSPPSKHDKYCKKAYDRYYADAQARIDLFDKNSANSENF
ncbi:MAG: EFR1 family ferrodoxin [Clostridiales bacterium]|nr:EFR1 family ferrodoxin [Clostridiales bacterium]